MKKIIGIIVVIVIIVVVALGVFFVYNQKEANKSLENEITPLAEDYFDKYMSTNESSNMYTVTLADLKEANENGESYDLSKLDGCKDDTSVTLTINYGTGKITKTEVELNCK